MSVWRTRSEEETREAGRELAERLRPDGTLLLEGDLGAGKTVLAQGVASGLGIDPLEVQSPTFTLVREHRGAGGEMIHLDLYRLAPADVEGIGIDEILERPAVKVVEWADRLPRPVGGALVVRLELLPDGGRRIEVIA